MPQRLSQKQMIGLFLKAGEDLSDRELAAESGLSTMQISRFRSGKHGDPVKKTLRKMKEYIDQKGQSPPTSADRTPHDIIGEIRIRLDQLEALTGEWKRLR